MMNARKKSHRTYRIRVYVLFVAFSIILPLLLVILAEGFASVIKAVRAGGWRSFAERKHAEFDDVLGWVNQQSIDVPDLYDPGLGLSTNSRRFRGRRETDDRIPAGKIRIVCSGDSYTLGYGVSDAHTYPQKLESLDPRLEVVNMGQGGYQGLRITIANLGYMGSFVSRANPDFCRTVLRLSDSVVTNTAHFYSRNII